jgi:hypothetical protein|tara:strand:- start:22 stop:231 length:210 start_codon:yes stop_codon:yes gene_type:complete
MGTDYLILSSILIISGAIVVYFTNKQSYERGITTAVLLHRNGRLKYKDYYDEDGERMVDIEIDPMDEED